jgi:hypothetical protein
MGLDFNFCGRAPNHQERMLNMTFQHLSWSRMTDALVSVIKSINPSVASRELATITSNYATENLFYTDGSKIDDESKQLYWDLQQLDYDVMLM